MVFRFLIVFLLSSLRIYSQTVPAAYQSEWHLAGFEGDFIEPVNVIDVTTAGAIANDGLNDDAALNSAISTANGSVVIYFPAGDYNFSSPVNLPDSLIIRGTGADSTHLIFDLANAQLNCFNFQGTAGAVFHSLSGGLSNGSNAVICQGAASLFNAGDYTEIHQLNGSWDTNPATWAQYAVGNLSRIDSVNADTIYLHDGLAIDLDISLQPEIRKILPVVNAGIECFRISRTDSLAPGINYAVYLNYAWNCRIKGIESYKSIGSHVIAEIAAHCVIRDSYFHEAYTFDGNNTRGYGVIMSLHSSFNKIENCVFRKLRHAMMVKQGANRNVYGHNYSLETLRSEFPSNASGDISVHGHYPFANLFEGNVCQNLMIDQAWGPSGPRNLFFRNRVELYGLIMTSGTVQSDSQAFAGNTFPSTAAFTGLYLLAGSGHFEHGNTVQGTIQPSGTNVLTDSSYYLDSVPSFIPQSAGFPAIGTGGSGSETNGAKIRYTSGAPLSYCNETTVSIGELRSESQNIKVWYNNGEIMLHYLPGKADMVILCDVSGRRLLNQKMTFINNQARVPVNLQPGIYFVRFITGGLSASFIVN